MPYQKLVDRCASRAFYSEPHKEHVYPHGSVLLFCGHTKEPHGQAWELVEKYPSIFCRTIDDMPLEAFWTHGVIRHWLHPDTHGYDPRDRNEVVAINRKLDPLVVSYAGFKGEPRVMLGPQDKVVARLRELGFKVRRYTL